MINVRTSQSLSFPKRSLLQPCWTDSKHFFHTGSNSTGLFQYCGNRENMVFFNCCSSFVGRPGSSRFPIGVHCFITLGPNKASLAILQAKVPALHSSFNLGYFSVTFSTVTSLSFLMAEEGSAFAVGGSLDRGSGETKLLDAYRRLGVDGAGG